jgi:hypothetical protein
VEIERYGTAEAAGVGYELPAVEWDAVATGPGSTGIWRESATAPVSGATAPVELPAEADRAAEEGAPAGAPPADVPPAADPGPGFDPDDDTAGGRLSKPMIATAATAGLVLIGLPLLLSHLAGGSDQPHRPNGRVAAGFTQPDGGGSGFVPGADPRQGTNAPAAHPSAPAHGPGSGPAHKGGSAGHAEPHGGTAPHGHKAPAGEHPGGGTRSKVRAANATYDAVSGPRCDGTGTDFHHYNWYGDGDIGWHDHTTGGWTGNGCDSVYQSVPMSGNASKDNANAVVWTFSTGAVTHGTCRVSVFIPRDTDVVAVGGDPTYYTVQNQFSRGSGTVGSFSIRQVAHRGQWVNAGSYRVGGGRFAVMLHSRGKGSKHAHHAAAPIRATCTAS